MSDSDAVRRVQRGPSQTVNIVIGLSNGAIASLRLSVTQPTIACYLLPLPQFAQPSNRPQPA